MHADTYDITAIFLELWLNTLYMRNCLQSLACFLG